MLVPPGAAPDLKVFGVGLNKTGTTSLGQFLAKAGFRLQEDSSMVKVNQALGGSPALLALAEDYSAFEDIPWPLVYRQCAERFPSARFVLTTRASADEWFTSMYRHSFRTGPTRQRKAVYGAYCPGDASREAYVNYYLKHNEEVRNFFANEAAQVAPPAASPQASASDGNAAQRIGRLLVLPSSLPNPEKSRLLAEHLGLPQLAEANYPVANKHRGNGASPPEAAVAAKAFPPQHSEAMADLRFEMEDLLVQTFLQHSAPNTLVKALRTSASWCSADRLDQQMVLKALLALASRLGHATGVQSLLRAFSLPSTLNAATGSESMGTAPTTTASSAVAANGAAATSSSQQKALLDPDLVLDTRKMTALHYAANFGNEKLYRSLVVEFGATESLRTKWGETAPQVVERGLGQFQSLQKLCQRGFPRVHIVVCYRATDQPVRAEQLRQFIEHFHNFNSRGDIHIIEQSADHPFNRGALLNAGFDIINKKFAGSAGAGASEVPGAEPALPQDVFVFHDVDLLPDKTLLAQYDSPPPVHFAAVWDRYAKDSKGKAKTDYMGGILSMSGAQFDLCGGFPNDFWGWGGEDDELRRRIAEVGLVQQVTRPSKGSIRDLENLTLPKKLKFLHENKHFKCADKWERRDGHIARRKQGRPPLGVHSVGRIYTLVRTETIGLRSYKHTVALRRTEQASAEEEADAVAATARIAASGRGGRSSSGSRWGGGTSGGDRRPRQGGQGRYGGGRRPQGSGGWDARGRAGFPPSGAGHHGANAGPSKRSAPRDDRHGAGSYNSGNRNPHGQPYGSNSQHRHAGGAAWHSGSSAHRSTGMPPAKRGR